MAEEHTRPSAMNVRELIKALSEMDGDLPVWGEGCDCTNPAVKVSLRVWGNSPHALIEVEV